MADQEKVTAVKQQYEQEWLSLKEVAAIGIGKVADEMGIIISVTENLQKMRRNLPDQIEGVPIRIKKTGAFKAQ